MEAAVWRLKFRSLTEFGEASFHRSAKPLSTEPHPHCRCRNECIRRRNDPRGTAGPWDLTATTVSSGWHPRQVGIHFSHLSKIENGKDPIGRDSLARIAEELGVAPDLILDRRGIKKPCQFRGGPQPAVSCACGTQILRSWATRRSWDRQPPANHPTRK